MQGKLIAVAYTLRTYWNQLSLRGICKQELMHQCSFSIRGGLKYLILIILIIRIIVSRTFHWFFIWKMNPMSGFDIRLVLTLPPRDSTLQYKRCVHLWNNFICITSLFVFMFMEYNLLAVINIRYSIHFNFTVFRTFCPHKLQDLHPQGKKEIYYEVKWGFV